MRCQAQPSSADYQSRGFGGIKQLNHYQSKWSDNGATCKGHPDDLIFRGTAFILGGVMPAKCKTLILMVLYSRYNFSFMKHKNQNECLICFFVFILCNYFKIMNFLKEHPQGVVGWLLNF